MRAGLLTLALIWLAASSVATDVHLEYEAHHHDLSESDTVDLDLLETIDTDVRAIGKVHLDEYFARYQKNSIPRRTFQNLLLTTELMMEPTEVRKIKTQYNNKVKLDEKETHIAKIANLVEEFMHSIPGLFISKAESYRLMESNGFHEYLKSEAGKIYELTRAKFNDLVADAKYHSELGSLSHDNPYQTYDHELENRDNDETEHSDL